MKVDVPHGTDPAALAADDGAVDVLRAPTAGGKVIRGGVVRGGGYAIGVVVGTGTAVLLLRHLGVVDFGRYVTVTALLGIVAGVTDAGLTAVGGREMAIRPVGQQREVLLANLILVRLATTVVGVLGAVAFAAIAGYDRTMVLGTVVGGIGLVLVNSQSMMTMPLWVDLRIVSLTVLEVLKQVLTFVGVAILVLAGASLLPFYAVPIPVGLALIVVTAIVLRSAQGLLPHYDRAMTRLLVHETVPLAIAFTMSVIYFRVLVILVSLDSTGRQTGLFATSFRIFETLLAAPVLILSVALPLLSVAGHEDDQRLSYALQRMTETALLAGAFLVLEVGILAEPAIRLIGGVQYLGAAPVLRVQALALLFVFLGQTWQLALIAARGQRVMAIANGFALVLVVALGLVLVPSHGALGAAWAAVVAEAALTACLWLGVRHVRPDATPNLRGSWKVAAALALGVAGALLLRLPAGLEAALAGLVFVTAAFLLRAIPPEIAKALRLRA